MTTLLIVLSLILLGTLYLLVRSNSKNREQELLLESQRKFLDHMGEKLQRETSSYDALDEQFKRLSASALELQCNQEIILQQRMDNWAATEAPRIRAEALQKQKQVRNGYTSEAFAPFAINDWAAEDFFRVGGSVDYLVIDGADAVRDKRQHNIDEVVLLDIKTGKADLNTVQRRIRDAVIAGRVAFATYNMDTQEMKRWDAQTQENGTK